VAGALPSATNHRMTPRLLLLPLALLTLAGCAGSAASLGLTGASLTTPPEAATDADIGTPGIQTGAGTYTPSVVPSTGPGRYFGSGE